MEKRRLFAGFSSIACSLLVLSVVACTIAEENESTVNGYLNVKTTKIVTKEGSENTDTDYYKPEYGDKTFSDENFMLLRQDTLQEAIEEEKEGAVLLQNNHDVLPLSSDTKSVVLLGAASAKPIYKSNSAGNQPDNDSEDVITLKQAFVNHKISVNDKVYDALTEKVTSRDYLNSITIGSATNRELPLSFYKGIENSMSEDTCIITLQREGGEGTDINMDDKDDDGTTIISGLALHKNERDLLTFARAKFGKVIVLLNSPNQMELEEVRSLSDAILYIGQPGLTGFDGVVSLLLGETSPSGRLADTYAVNSLSAPATVNSGTRTPEFANQPEIKATLKREALAEWCSFQAENIYVGYKYYETRYDDCVKNRFHASSLHGSSFSSGWNYSSEITYPFGYGLSYTSFTETLEDVKIKEDEIEVKVSVRNTGSTKGKHVVEVYSQTPYGDYEIDNKIEKSAVQIVGYSKTKELAPEESETLTISIDRYLLASYDEYQSKGYIVSEGLNYIALGEDSHDALNNILAYQGYSSLVDQDGKNVTADKSKVYQYRTDFDNEKYRYSNGYEVTNQFTDCDINHWVKDSGTYLSRSDWDKTYPVSQTTVTADEEMMRILNGETYVMREDHESAASIPLGVDKGLSLVSMKDASYDDPLWDDFISQMSMDEIATLTAENTMNPGIESINQPDFLVGDGMDSLGASYTTKEGKKILSMTYACKSILTCSFNNELYSRRGFLMGQEALFMKLMENYNIGADLHRTPFGGRNFEYMSEDAILSYLASIPETEAMEKCGTHASPKHCCGNDQEYRREGVAVFFNEQAFRENSLRAFEGALKVAKAGSLMQSFERMGLTWCSQYKPLNVNVIRNEWGFIGNIVTDATFSSKRGYKSHCVECIDAGTEQFCLDTQFMGKEKLLQHIQETDDGDILRKMMAAAKSWEYAISRTGIINGLSSDNVIVHITPWWKIVFIVIDITSALAGALFFSLSLYLSLKKQKDAE